jgi:hypothetical protein
MLSPVGGRAKSKRPPAPTGDGYLLTVAGGVSLPLMMSDLYWVIVSIHA